MSAAIEIAGSPVRVEIVDASPGIEIAGASERIEVVDTGDSIELVELAAVVEIAPAPEVVIESPAVLIEVAPATEKGDAGQDATWDLTYPAASAISGHRVVRYDPTAAAWVYADAASAVDAAAELAVTLGAISAGASGAARLAGTLDEPSWAWPAPCVLFLGAAGALTPTPPTNGYLREIARAITPTRIQIDPQPAIALAA